MVLGGHGIRRLAVTFISGWRPLNREGAADRLCYCGSVPVRSGPVSAFCFMVAGAASALAGAKQAVSAAFAGQRGTAHWDFGTVTRMVAAIGGRRLDRRGSLFGRD